MEICPLSEHRYGPVCPGWGGHNILVPEDVDVVEHQRSNNRDICERIDMAHWSRYVVMCGNSPSPICDP